MCQEVKRPSALFVSEVAAADAESVGESPDSGSSKAPESPGPPRNSRTERNACPLRRGLIWALFLLKLYLVGGDLPESQGPDQSGRVGKGLSEGLERRKPSEGFPRVAVHVGE